MQPDSDLRDLIEAERAAAPGWWPVAILLAPVPVDLYALTMQALDAALTHRGYLSAFRQRTGLTVVWARPRTEADIIPPPGQPPLPEVQLSDRGNCPPGECVCL